MRSPEVKVIESESEEHKSRSNVDLKLLEEDKRVVLLMSQPEQLVNFITSIIKSIGVVSHDLSHIQVHIALFVDFLVFEFQVVQVVVNLRNQRLGGHIHIEVNSVQGKIGHQLPVFVVNYKVDH